MDVLVCPYSGFIINSALVASIFKSKDFLERENEWQTKLAFLYCYSNQKSKLIPVSHSLRLCLACLASTLCEGECVCMHVYTVWKSKDNFRELVFSLVMQDLCHFSLCGFL